MGVKVEVVSLDAAKNPWTKIFPVPVHALGEREGSTGYGYSKKLVPWLKENRTKYDAVITHGLWQFQNVGTWRALRGTDTPYYVFPHGMLDPWFKQAYPVKHFKKWVYWTMRERHVLRDAAAVLFTCEEEMRLARETFKSYQCVEKVVPLGIAPPALNAVRQRTLFFEKFPRYLDRHVLLFLGRLHDKKGCEMLIEAFGKMTGKLDESHHLAMAGPCEDEAYKKRLIQIAEAHCPPGSVSFPGMVSGDFKWGAFQSAEVFLLPSHQENFGIAVVEALACGLPVLISNKVNIYREIEEDGAGIVQADDPEGTLALLEKWVAMKEPQREAMRKAARLSFEKRFQVKRMADELLALVAANGQKTSDVANATS